MTSSFQSGATEQARQFASQCETLLRQKGFDLEGRLRIPRIGVEIDCVATRSGGTTVWFEFKGSIQGARPGLRRTDTLKKAIANGALIRAIDDPPPYVVLASHLPTDGFGRAMLETALELNLFADVICRYDPDSLRRLDLL